jgi:hypothetical protein
MLQTSFASLREYRAPQRTAVFAWLALQFLNGSAAWSQQSETPKDAPVSRAEAKISDRLHEAFLREVTDYDFSLDAENRQKLELRREPVMRFTAGPNDFQGEVYIWTDHGLAAVVGCVWTGPLEHNRRLIFHEFHSLSSQPLVSGSRGGTKWHSEEVGIKLEPIPDAPPPAENEPRRLTQMRNLARSFSADMTKQGAKSDLRLLPQPLFRYEPTNKDSQVIDGAVFAYVWTGGALDPEVFLVIEARRAASGASWQFAPARFTNREAAVKHQGKLVWRAEADSPGIFDGVTTKRYGVFSVKTIAIGPGE